MNAFLKLSFPLIVLALAELFHNHLISLYLGWFLFGKNKTHQYSIFINISLEILLLDGVSWCIF